MQPQCIDVKSLLSCTIHFSMTEWLPLFIQTLFCAAKFLQELGAVIVYTTAVKAKGCVEQLFPAMLHSRFGLN